MNLTVYLFGEIFNKRLVKVDKPVFLKKTYGYRNVALCLGVHSVAEILVKGCPIVFGKKLVSLHHKKAVGGKATAFKNRYVIGNSL